MAGEDYREEKEKSEVPGEPEILGEPEESEPDGEPIFAEIEFPDGRTVEYELLGIFGFGENRYLALYPVEQQGGEVNLFPIEEGPDGRMEFREFFDDEEYQMASDFFETWVNEGTDVLFERAGIASESVWMESEGAKDN